jgi:hypothetical protein
LATGYLYVLGKSPADYNFQHPPLLKYLYGFSLRFFKNPYPVQITLSFFLFFLTYLLGVKVALSRKAIIMALVLLALDPLTADVVFNVYLDLGLAVFTLAFVLAFIYYPKKWWVQGLLLGLLLAAKFWSIGLFLLTLLTLYRFLILKNLKMKLLLKTLLIASLVYLFTYSALFLKGGSLGGFVWLQLKMVKFMLVHNSASFWGGQLGLFLSGYYSGWWGGGGFLRSNLWCFFWPLSFCAMLLSFLQKELRPKLRLFVLIVFGFFLITLRGAPFARYLILITPYLYLGLFPIYLS